MNTSTFLKMSIVSIGLASLVACQGGTPSDTGSSSSKKPAKVLAEVNGVAITSDDFDREVKSLPEYLRAMAETPQIHKELIDTLVMRELVLQQAKKDGVDKSKEVEDKLVDIRKRIVVDTYLKKKIEADAKVSDDEMKKFYEQNLDKFKGGEQVRASHILVKSEEEAKAVQAQLKGGAKFEDVAKAKSVDSSAAKGGDLGWFAKGSMVPVFEQTAFSLKDGETSGIVKSEFGYHIIKVTGKRAAGTRSFDEVKDQIKASMLPQKQQQAFMKLREDLKKGAKIDIKGETPAPQQPAAQPQDAAKPALPTAPVEKK